MVLYFFFIILFIKFVLLVIFVSLNEIMFSKIIINFFKFSLCGLVMICGVGLELDFFLLFGYIFFLVERMLEGFFLVG